MRQPESHPEAYHPPEAGRTDGPRMQMGEVGTGSCIRETESVGSGMDGNWNWDSQRVEWGLVRMDTKRGRKIGF